LDFRLFEERRDRLTCQQPEEVYADREYIGKTMYRNTKIHTPKSTPRITNARKQKHCKRARIETIIGLLKKSTGSA
jgi:hypothetical protein